MAGADGRILAGGAGIAIGQMLWDGRGAGLSEVKREMKKERKEGRRENRRRKQKQKEEAEAEERQGGRWRGRICLVDMEFGRIILRICL